MILSGALGITRPTLPHHAGAAAADGLFDFFAGGHGGVAGGRRGERAVGGAILDGFLGVVELEETELQARGERVTAAHAVEDLEAGILPALVEFAVVPENRAPVVDRRGVDVAERGRSDLEVF